MIVDNDEEKVDRAAGLSARRIRFEDEDVEDGEIGKGK